MGYGTVYVSKDTNVGTYKNIKVVKCELIKDVLQDVGFSN